MPYSQLTFHILPHHSNFLLIFVRYKQIQKMKEKNPSSEIIIVLTEHPVLGVLLTPYLAEQSPEGDEIRLMEQAFHASNKVMEQMTEAERKAIEIASYYTEKHLMQLYSNEKIPSRFLQKLSTDPAKIKKTVRPYIDEKLIEMVKLILQEDLTFYQKQSRSNVLYPHNAYNINRQPVKTSFIFELNGAEFSYQLECEYEDRPLAITEHKPVVVVTTSQATLLLGMELYFFDHMESSRLMPFTKRTRITVDAEHLQKYIDNIIIPIARYHKISTRGLDISKDLIAAGLEEVEHEVLD